MKQLIKNKQANWLPDYYADDVLQIEFWRLRRKGIKACMFDLDHTLLVQHEVVIDVRIVEHLRRSDMDIYIATNRFHSKELDEIAKQVNAKGIMHAKSRKVYKPRRAYYENALQLTGLKANQVAMVGDRMVQDVWGAKRAGITSILVGKFGPIRGVDHILTLHDRLVPIVFANYFKDI